MSSPGGTCTCGLTRSSGSAAAPPPLSRRRELSSRRKAAGFIPLVNAAANQSKRTRSQAVCRRAGQVRLSRLGNPERPERSTLQKQVRASSTEGDWRPPAKLSAPPPPLPLTTQRQAASHLLVQLGRSHGLHPRPYWRWVSLWCKKFALLGSGFDLLPAAQACRRSPVLPTSAALQAGVPRRLTPPPCIRNCRRHGHGQVHRGSVAAGPGGACAGLRPGRRGSCHVLPKLCT